MTTPPTGPPSKPSAPLWFPRIMTGLAILWCLGWLFHTCPYPILFGKYNARYLVFLSALFLLFPLLVYVTTKFFVTTSELKGSRGRKILITPVQKLTAGLVLSIIGGLSVSWLIGWIMGSGVSTRGAHVFHPYLQNVPRPNHVEQHVNRWGFKGNEIELAKPADTYRVFVFGGSTVHCGTVPWEQTHVRMLEKKLREKYPDRKIEVMNLGAEWHCSQHDVIKLLFDAQEFSPDLVVIFHGINDLVRGLDSELFGEGPYRQDYRQYYGAVTNMARRGNTWTMINTVGGHWLSDFRFQQVRLAGPEGNGLNGSLTLFFPKSEPMEVTQWKSLPAFERNMRRFVQVAQEKKYEVLLATQASLYRKDLSAIDEQVLVFPKSHMVGRKHVSLESMTEGMKQFNDVTKQIAEDTKVHFVDLEAAMPKTVEYMYDDVHYTAKGNELIAVELAKAIIAAELVPQGLDARKASP